MRLRAPVSRGRISPVPLVDVLLILLIFFMVTSRYDRLGAVPILTERGAAGVAPPAGQTTLLLRLDAAGSVWAAGRELPGPELEEFLIARRTVRLRVLASPEATTQSLVRIAESAARAGIADLRLVRVVEGN